MNILGLNVTGGSSFRDHGLRLIGGSFGAGKTKNVFQDCMLRKKENPQGLLIANVPYDFVDIYFSSKDDLNKILMFIKRYIEETNISEFFKSGFKKPIRLVIDEGHIYYFSRDFAKLDKEILLILTQCRKRRISIDIITQELRQIDTFMRNLSPYVYRYKDLFLGFRKQSILYMPNADVTSITDDKVKEIDREIIFPDWWQKLFNRDLLRFFKQRFLTYHIIGLESRFSLTYDEFYTYLNYRDDINKQILVNNQSDVDQVEAEIPKLSVEEEETIRTERERKREIEKNTIITKKALYGLKETINGFTSHKISNDS